MNTQKYGVILAVVLCWIVDTSDFYEYTWTFSTEAAARETEKTWEHSKILSCGDPEILFEGYGSIEKAEDIEILSSDSDVVVDSWTTNGNYWSLDGI